MLSRLKDEPLVIRRIKSAARKATDRSPALPPQPLDLMDCRRRLSEMLGAQILDCFRLVHSAEVLFDGAGSLAFMALLLPEHLPIRVEARDLREGRICFTVSGYDLYARAHPLRNPADYARLPRFETLGKALVEAERGFRILLSRCQAPWRKLANDELRGKLPEELWLHAHLYSTGPQPQPAQTTGFEAITCEVWASDDDPESQALLQQIDHAAQKLGTMRTVDPLTLRTGSRVLFRIRGRSGRFFNASAILVKVERDAASKNSDRNTQPVGGRLGEIAEETLVKEAAH